MARCKVRDEHTWAEIRRSWERGETAGSLALRYDVGLSNLWRRRTVEGWSRERTREPDPTPEPVEGWNRWADGGLGASERERDEARILTRTLLEMLEGGRPERAPTWHIGWLMAERARRRPDRAEADRANRPEGRG